MLRILKYLLFTFLSLIALVFIFSFVIYVRYQLTVSQTPGQINDAFQPGELGKWVNPFIGTGGFPAFTTGNDMPGSTVPFGMVRLCPDTRFFLKKMTNKTFANTSGYYFADNHLMGFSHTRMVGTGVHDGGHFRVYPATGSQSSDNYRKGKYHRFSHKNETAFPGYYAVMLKKPGILAELTATERTGVHRYTFSGKENPRIIIDVASSLGSGKSSDGEIHVSSDGEITGTICTFGNFAARYGGQQIYFSARFSKPFSEFAFWSGKKAVRNSSSIQADTLGIDVVFNKNVPSEVIELRLGISYVSIENARENLEVETGGLTFEEIQKKAVEKWEEKLSLIKIEGGTDEQKTIFYSALYRSMQMPTLFNDVNGDYKGFDKKIHRVEDYHRYFTDLSLWDTFRTVHPLFTLILPDDQRDMLRSLVKMSEHGGWLPRWPSGYGYTGSMLGSSADIVISESYQKGIRDFDVETAYRAMRKAALAVDLPKEGFKPRPGTDVYMEYGYCPAESMRGAVSKTIEYAWADDAISKLATELNYAEDAALFAQRAQYYRNVWNPETQYFHPRKLDGSFQQKFDPLKLTYLDSKRTYTDAYVEGSALQWRWAPFFDASGLISLFRDTAYFVNELNNFFEKANPKLGTMFFGPYYWHGNEPDIHAAYLFNDADRPDLTQKWVRWILDHKYGADHNGMDGDDDAGTLSAWYVLSSLGFYPVAGSVVYRLGIPLFQKAEIRMGENLLTVRAENDMPENKYVKSVQLNGKLLDRWYLKHDEIAEGGTLVFEMSKEPQNVHELKCNGYNSNCLRGFPAGSSMPCRIF